MTTTSPTGKIIDMQLVNRLGALDRCRMAAIEDEAAEAFMLGMPSELAQEISLTLFWRAHGHPVSCSTAHLVQILAPELEPWHRRELAERLNLRRAAMFVAKPDTIDEQMTVDLAPLNAVWGPDAQFGALLREALDRLASAPPTST